MCLRAAPQPFFPNLKEPAPFQAADSSLGSGLGPVGARLPNENTEEVLGAPEWGREFWTLSHPAYVDILPSAVGISAHQNRDISLLRIQTTAQNLDT